MSDFITETTFAVLAGLAVGYSVGLILIHSGLLCLR